MTMELEQALSTALDYEVRVRDHYRASATASGEGAAERFYRVLADEEQGHVEYLEYKLDQWRSSGDLTEEAIATVIPSREWLQKGLARMDSVEGPVDATEELERLRVALELEREVSGFYRELVDGVDHPRARKLFARFLEIEDGHTAVVQAEMDRAMGTGYFFDLREFTLE